MIDADLARPSAPVYFDFEGAWSRILGVPGTRSYPRSIPHGSVPGRTHGRASTEEVAALVAVPFLPHDAEHPGLRIARRFGRVPRYRRRLEPFVERRYFLDPSTLPGYLDWALNSVVFVHGRLRPRAAPEEPFRRLVSACAVAPFLYVTDGHAVLLAGMSPPPLSPGKAAPPPRPSITRELQRFLEEIEVFREPVPGMRTLTNHRYDRLFEGNGREPTHP